MPILDRLLDGFKRRTILPQQSLEGLHKNANYEIKFKISLNSRQGMEQRKIFDLKTLYSWRRQLSVIMCKEETQAKKKKKPRKELLVPIVNNYCLVTMTTDEPEYEATG